MLNVSMGLFEIIWGKYMAVNRKMAIAGVLGGLMLLGAETEAMAWGCVAVANDGTYGYSYNYGSRKA